LRQGEVQDRSWPQHTISLDGTCSQSDLVPQSFSFLHYQAPIFSFTRLRGADPTLGVEMASTGEVACFGENSHQAFLQAMLATTFQLPNKNRTILLSIASEKFRAEFAESVEIFVKLGYKLYATPGTAAYYEEHHDIKTIIVVQKPSSESDDAEGTAIHAVKQGIIDLAINVSEGTTRKDEITSGYLIRRAVVDFGVSLITDLKCAVKFAECLDRGWGDGKFEPLHVGEFYKLPMIGWAKP
jgi:MGS-like domain